MTITEAVVVYGGRGITTTVQSLTPTSMTIISDITPAAGDTIAVFFEGVGKISARVADVAPPVIDLSFVTDRQEDWRQLQALRREINAEKVPAAE